MKLLTCALCALFITLQLVHLRVNETILRLCRSQEIAIARIQERLYLSREEDLHRFRQIERRQDLLTAAARSSWSQAYRLMRSGVLDGEKSQ